VRRSTQPKFTLDYTRTHASADLPRGQPAPPITRLAWSKEGTFLASLALAQDTAYITVWDMCLIGDLTNPLEDMPDFYRKGAVMVIPHTGIGALSIGLAISANGDQVAIFQEPRIGELANRSSLEATFPFHLFSNPSAHNYYSLNMLQGNSRSGGGSFHSARTSTGTSQLQLQPLDCHEKLRTFVGRGTFLAPSVGSSGNRFTFSALRSFTAFGVSLTRGISFSGDGGNPNKSKGVQTDGLFAACNGQSLNIFRASLDKWDHIKSIPLEDSTTMGFGRMTCMMMDSIGSNAFMWVGKEGKCCISNLDDGSNISQISSAENTTFIHPTTLQGFATMALSPDGSIVALADDKGTVTTYYTDSGVAIIDRSFPECSIEHIGFHGNNHQLYVVTRDKDADLRCRIIDARQPTYELTGSKIPIPVGGSTIFAFFQEHRLRGQGIFCEANGKSINCYNLYSPRSTDKAKAKVADSNAITQRSLIDQNITYHLRAEIHKELLVEEDGASNGIFWVDLIEENLAKRTQRIVFSFVPEPWMHVPTTTAIQQSPVSVYFLPCGTRFATVGQQTIQIWSLPTVNDHRVSLLFICSDPETGKVDLRGRECDYEKVGCLYQSTKRPSIYVDESTGGTIAMVGMDGREGTEIIPLPGVGNTNGHYAILPCFRSIHLLAAIYAFSHSHSEDTMKETPQRRLTFRNHAEAIVQFTRKFINFKAFLVHESRETFDVYNIGRNLDWTEVSRPHGRPSGRPSGEVTILRLLLEQNDLRGINHNFVEGLLGAANGHWIPDENVAYNPISCAINTKNKRLLNVLIDYCTRCAKLYHPAYVSPIVQCLKDLADHYPLDTADILRKMSYIPVTNQPPSKGQSNADRDYYQPMKNVNYLASHLLDVFHYDLGVTNTPKNIDNYDTPRFNLRRRLTDHPSVHTSRKQGPVPPQKDHNFLSPNHVYVTPFLYFPTSMESFPTLFSGERVLGYIDTPVVLASLQFRWYDINS